MEQYKIVLDVEVCDEHDLQELAVVLAHID